MSGEAPVLARGARLRVVGLTADGRTVERFSQLDADGVLRLDLDHLPPDLEALVVVPAKPRRR